MENNDLTRNRNVDNSGYSEKRLDADTDLQAGQWLDLSKKKQLANSKQQSVASNQKSFGASAKLLKFVKDLVKELEQKVEKFEDQSTSLDDLASLSKDIERLQAKIHTVLRAVQFERKGTLDISKLPKEVQDLVK